MKCFSPIVKKLFVSSFFAFLVFFVWSCKEKEPFPQLLDEETKLSGLSDATVEVTSDILAAPPGELQEYGHVWIEGDGSPTLANQRTKLFAGTVPSPFVFTSSIVGLKKNTSYSLRAYIQTTSGTVYGKVVSFQTEPDYINRLVKILDDSLKGRDFGYSFVVMRRGVVAGSGYGGWQARAVEMSGQIPVSLDSKMQIASMTKTLTATAFLRLAAGKGVRTTDKIIDYLPSDWVKGPGIDKVSFRDLILHRSGITGAGNFCQNGALLENIWLGLKEIVAKGVSDPNYGNYCYQNANYGLFRVLIPSLLGYSFTGDEDTDNTETMRLYEEYIRKEVIEKAGVSPGNLLENDLEKPTYGYDFPYTQQSHGFNPGSFRWHSGGYGFYLSAAEAGKVFSAIVDENNFSILTKAQKDTILTKNFGSYAVVTPQGNYRYHDGWWQINLASGKPKGFRSIWMSGPDDVVVVMFTNALRNGDGLFPLSAFQYQDITSYLLWAFSKLHQDSGAARMSDLQNFHDYLPDPNPH